MGKTTLKKNAQGYGYKYTDLAEIHEYLESNEVAYYQFIKREDGDDYVFTQRTNTDGEPVGNPIQGCRVVQATLQGIKNPAQEQGSALTYARRYSLLMAFGLATDDDDGAGMTAKTQASSDKAASPKQKKFLNELFAQKHPDHPDVVQWIADEYSYVAKDLTSEQASHIIEDLK